MADPCEHLDFAAFVDVARVTPTEGAPVGYFSAEVKVFCAACDVALRVIDPGLPVGVLPGRVTTCSGGLELRVPMWPDDGTEPAIGLMAGFTIRHRMPPSDLTIPPEDGRG